MSYKIVVELCINCGACEAECPNVAIREKNGEYIINAKKCTECIGYFDDPQCVTVCPVDDTCVIDESVPRYEAIPQEAAI